MPLLAPGSWPSVGRLPGLLQNPQGLGVHAPIHPPGSLEGDGGCSGCRSSPSSGMEAQVPPRNICPHPSASPCVCWQWTCPTLPRPLSGWCAVVSGSEEVNLSPGVGVEAV